MCGKTPPARLIMTSRRGGFSAPPYDSFNLGGHVGDDPTSVGKNRSRLARTLGLQASQIVWMDQQHTATVTVVNQPHDGPVAATDALVTQTPGLALAVLVADCVPVLLADPTNKIVAAVHAGRQGARDGIVPQTLTTMWGLGASPETTNVLIGPAASGENYEVPEAMARDVEKHLPGSLARTHKGTFGLDIRAGIVRQLKKAGIKAITVDPRCTIEDLDFFSYRRDGLTGRQAGLVWLT